MTASIPSTKLPFSTNDLGSSVKNDLVKSSHSRWLGLQSAGKESAPENSFPALTRGQSNRAITGNAKQN